MLIYIFIILIFATIYSVMSNQFYHTTVRYEPTMREEENKLKNEISNDIKINFKFNNKGDSTFLDSNKRWLFNINSLEVYNVEENNGLSIKINMLVTDTASQNNKGSTSTFISHLVLIDLNLTNDIFQSKYSILRNGNVNKNHNFDIEDMKYINYDSIFNIKGLNNSNNTVGIKISSSLNNEINDFVNESNGFRSKIQGIIFKMIYLSLVTITTLGFGDIVPITDLARLLVGIEAFLGVFIMGLFINSISVAKNSN
ncbi:potassium channel family protein [Clostridium tagluense]|uniref:potassium channel family protein n=1 Tax=Clostridium tagluense TaxID=360422 RepID=UPI001C0CF85D|nr:potassium channel family protein [Clostridium tagluense]MBU3130285.1 potassium channel family protein [Clostridium tagluense]